jgi:superkiller protein 3
MSPEKIEQQVILNDQAQVHGDITLIGKMVQVIKNPALWPDAVFHFLSAHRYILLLIAALEGSLLALFFLFKDLYLLSWGLWGLTAVLLLVSLWTTYTTVRYVRTPVRMMVMAVSTLAFFSLVGWQSWQITNPPTFAPQVFGIAIAELGEGGAFQRTSSTRAITDQIYESLCEELRRKQPAADGTGPATCPTPTNPVEGGNIAVTRIGVMPDSETAAAFGQRIGADVVVWGQLLSQENGGITLRFTVLESIDRVTNPDFPVVMHVTANANEILITERDLDNDVRQIKETVAKQSLLLFSFIRGMAAYLNQEYAETARQLESALEFVENDPLLTISPEGKSLIYYYLARANQNLSHVEEGQAMLQQAQAANPEEPAVLIALALGYRTQGLAAELDESTRLALNMLNDWLRTAPQDTNALFDRGLVYQIRRRYTEAAQDYQAVLQNNPEFYIAYIQLGVVTYELGQLAAAAEAIEAGIDLAERSGTNPAAAYLELGRIYQKAGEVDLAREAYWQAVSHNPHVDRIYLYFAQFIEEQGELDAALWAYEQMVEVSATKGWAYGELAGFYRRHRILEKALLNYERAIDFDNENPLLYAYLAETHFDLGHQEAALTAFERAVSLNAEAGIYTIYALYGGVLYQLGEFAAAVDMYQKSISLEPLDAGVWLNLGQTYTQLGQVAEAVDTYCKMLNLDDALAADKLEIARQHLAGFDQENNC